MTTLTILWCVPRSVSTAFEKMIWHSDRFEVISEPFKDLYKQSLLSSASFVASKQRVRTICDDLLNRSTINSVFVKDMAYHAEPFLTDEFILSANHVFLTRDPQLSIPSLFKMRPDFTEDQPGFEGQLRLLSRIETLFGYRPMVFDAQSLIQNPVSVVSSFFDYIGQVMPTDILTWPIGSQTAWVGRESWHIDAINSTGFDKRPTQIDLDSLPDRVLNSIRANRVRYTQILGSSLNNQQS